MISILYQLIRWKRENYSVEFLMSYVSEAPDEEGRVVGLK